MYVPKWITSARNERDARVREQYAARERQIDFSDRNALIGELADIEAAKDHNPDSKWNKRLERAWRSGDRVTYEKVEREMADTGVDINTVFDALVNPYKAGAKGMLKLLAKMGVNIVANVVGESVEEGLQEGVSIANESRDGTGIINLLGNTGSTIDSVITNADPAARQRILNAMSEGAKLSLMTAGPGVVAGQSINTNTTQSTQAKSDTEDTDGNAGENVAGLSIREKLLSKAKNPKVINAVNQLYRPGAYTGDGGTADAIRHEIFTGTATNGRSHIQKGQDWIRALIKIRTSELLTSDEKLMLDDLIDDLQSALKGD